MVACIVLLQFSCMLSDLLRGVSMNWHVKRRWSEIEMIKASTWLCVPSIYTQKSCSSNNIHRGNGNWLYREKKNRGNKIMPSKFDGRIGIYNGCIKCDVDISGTNFAAVLFLIWFNKALSWTACSSIKSLGNISPTPSVLTTAQVFPHFVAKYYVAKRCFFAHISYCVQ